MSQLPRCSVWTIATKIAPQVVKRSVSSLFAELTSGYTSALVSPDVIAQRTKKTAQSYSKVVNVSKELRRNRQLPGRKIASFPCIFYKKHGIWQQQRKRRCSIFTAFRRKGQLTKNGAIIFCLLLWKRFTFCFSWSRIFVEASTAKYFSKAL